MMRGFGIARRFSSAATATAVKPRYAPRVASTRSSLTGSASLASSVKSANASAPAPASAPASGQQPLVDDDSESPSLSSSFASAPSVAASTTSTPTPTTSTTSTTPPTPPPSHPEFANSYLEQKQDAPPQTGIFADEYHNLPPTTTTTTPNPSPSCWTTSFAGIGSQPFPAETAKTLLAPLSDEDIEIKPDGLLYLPEIKYRRILNRAFGPGGWGMAPRGPHNAIGKVLTREYALIVNGRFVSQARGEQDFFSNDMLPTATEGVKSNALMRCCKDLGIASELWDPSFIRKWKAKNAVEVWATDLRTRQKKRLWRLKDEKLSYPFQE